MTAALIIGAPGVPSISSTDDGLALARDLFGDGSELYLAALAGLVEGVAGAIYREEPQGMWLWAAEHFEKLHPVLGRHVRRHVCERLMRLAFKPLGAWLEERWPWLFVDARPDGDEAFTREAA